MRKRNTAIISFILAINTLLTACSSNSNSRKNGDNYNSSAYHLVYVDGTPYLTYDNGASLWEYYYGGKIDMYDVTTDNQVASITNYKEKNESTTFSNEIGSNVSRYAIISLTDFFTTETFSQEMYDFLATGSEEVDKFIEDNYLYDVVWLQEFKGETYKTYLGIYGFPNSINGEIEYHLGYNANRIYNCDFIYDIIDNKIYHKPELDSYTFVAISALTEQSKITATDAKAIMDNYLAENQSRNLKK